MRTPTSRVCALATALLLSSDAVAALDVFTCEPEWAALTSELAGDKANIYSATTAYQDPHYIQARPSLISKARRADLLVCTGAGLEEGWLPVLLGRSGNAAIQPGRSGSLFAHEFVDMIEVPTELDRSHGHVHADGNPHFHVDPRRMLVVAEQISDRLQQLDSENAAFYLEKFTDFSAGWQRSIADWEQRAGELDGKKVISHHRYWAYLSDWLGFEIVAELEPVPGVQPSVAHLSSLKETYAEQAEMIIRVSYSEPRAADWLASRTGLPVAKLPSTVDFQAGQTLEQWYDALISAMMP